MRCKLMASASQNDAHGWREEGRSFLRAIAGGSLVGIPLLFTMEMWQHGMSFSEWELLLILAATLLLNTVFCYLSGFRDENSFGSAVMESVTAVAIALLFSTVILGLIGELEIGGSWRVELGKILVEAAAVSMGISFANSQMKGSRGEDEGNEGAPKREEVSAGDRQLKADLREFSAAAVGSTIFALNVAPTEEITLIAARLSPWQLLALLMASLLLCYIILFAAGFRKHEVHVEGIFQHPVVEMLLTAAISLITAGFLLLLLGEGSLLSHPATAVASIVTLGLPAIIGGAAGRLVA